MLRLFQSLTLIAASAALLAQPARAHSSHAHASYRHRSHPRSVALRHREVIGHGRLALRHWRRDADRFAPEYEAAPSVNARAYGSWQPIWQPMQGRQPRRERVAWQDSFALRESWQAGEQGAGEAGPLHGMAEQEAGANGIPVSLVDRVIKRESGGNPRAISRGNYGLMQIRLGTARAMGYGGSAAGLLDPATNMTYAVRYLAGAYRAAGGNPDRAVALYASGYGAAPRAQYAAYDGERPAREAAFTETVSYDQAGPFAPPSSMRPPRHPRRRSL